MSLYSDCCSASPLGGMEEYGICGDCKEHCEFWDDEETKCDKSEDDLIAEQGGKEET